MKLYGELSSWYRLLTPLKDYEGDAATYLSALRIEAPVASLLELGCGAGHNAHYLKAELSCTLTDLSPEMLALSEEINPECEHHLADMRTLRLERTFDAVFAHDAVAYMRTRDDLRAAIATARAHLSPGGVALFAPDDLKDDFVESTRLHHGTDGERTLRCIERNWDPDPEDDDAVSDFTFELSGPDGVVTVEDRHVCGLFWAATWWQLLIDGGFEPRILPGPDNTRMFYATLVR